MLGLSTKQLAIVVTATLHLIAILVFAISRLSFDPNKDWTYLKMSMKEYEIPKEVPKIEEIAIPKNYEEVGLEQKKYSVAQTNKAVNQATDKLSKGERDKISSDVDAEVERMAREASQSGFFEKGKTEGSLTGSIAEEKPKKKSEKKSGTKKGELDKGNLHDKATNISFYLKNRTEGAIGLHNPVYVCQSGGKVVIDITVNRFGDVVSAKINNSKTEAQDHCLHEAAKQSALLSTFNEDLTAEEKQRGSITYVFVGQ